MTRDIAINAKRQDDGIRVRVLIRPKLRPQLDKAARATGAGSAAVIREINCLLNNRLVVSVDAGQHFNGECFFEFVLGGGQVGDAIQVIWVDTAGDAGRGMHILK